MNIIRFWSSILFSQSAWFLDQWIIITLLATSFFRLFCFWHNLPQSQDMKLNYKRYLWFLKTTPTKKTPLCTVIGQRTVLKLSRFGFLNFFSFLISIIFLWNENQQLFQRYYFSKAVKKGIGEQFLTISIYMFLIVFLIVYFGFCFTFSFRIRAVLLTLTWMKSSDQFWCADPWFKGWLGEKYL